MKSLKIMLLGLLIVLIGVSLLFVLNSAITTAMNPFTQDPLVTLFLRPTSNSMLAYVEESLTVIRIEEAAVVAFMLLGLLVAFVGYFRKE